MVFFLHLSINIILQTKLILSNNLCYQVVHIPIELFYLLKLMDYLMRKLVLVLTIHILYIQMTKYQLFQYITYFLQFLGRYKLKYLQMIYLQHPLIFP